MADVVKNYIKEEKIADPAEKVRKYVLERYAGGGIKMIHGMFIKGCDNLGIDIDFADFSIYIKGCYHTDMLHHFNEEAGVFDGDPWELPRARYSWEETV